MRRALAVGVCVVVALAGCRSDQGPLAGELSVRLTTPHVGDRAVTFVVTGRLHGVTAASGSAYRIFADTSADGDTAQVVVVAPAGGGLVTGEVARVRVDDTRQFRRYAARVLQIAASNYFLADTTGVSLAVVKP
jgi:hypothetical protein